MQAAAPLRQRLLPPPLSRSQLRKLLVCGAGPRALATAPRRCPPPRRQTAVAGAAAVAARRPHLGALRRFRHRHQRRVRSPLRSPQPQQRSTPQNTNTRSRTLRRPSGRSPGSAIRSKIGQQEITIRKARATWRRMHRWINQHRHRHLPLEATLILHRRTQAGRSSQVPTKVEAGAVKEGYLPR